MNTTGQWPTLAHKSRHTFRGHHILLELCTTQEEEEEEGYQDLDMDILYLNLDRQENCPLLRLEAGEELAPIFPLMEDHLLVVVEHPQEAVEDYPNISLEMVEDRRWIRPTVGEILQ